MRLMKLARSYMKQAKSRLKDAAKALSENNFPYALRLSQECVELSLKASLRLVGVEYPKVHDVSEILLSFKERFPSWFQEKMDEVARVSASLAMKREIAFYGAEDEAVSPEEVVSRTDAEKAVKDAEQIYILCEKMLYEYESKPSP